VSTADSLAVAVTFLWLGMVLAISFIEAPIKFRAPNVTLQIGLGIGRLVFRALNSVETVAAIVLIGCLVASHHRPQSIATGVAILALVAQLVFVSPALKKRSDVVLAGGEAPRSKAHHAYIALEVVKVIALIVAGAGVLSR